VVALEVTRSWPLACRDGAHASLAAVSAALRA